MLKKTLESPLDCKEIKSVNSKGNQPQILIGRNDAEAETPGLLPPDVKNWLIGKDPDAGKDWRQEEKGSTEDEMVGWHHRLKGHEFQQIQGDGEGEGSLACCSPWSHKELDRTEQQQYPKRSLKVGKLFYPLFHRHLHFKRGRPGFWNWLRQLHCYSHYPRNRRDCGGQRSSQL